ncbi:MAG TPA: aspartate--tRNA ligase [Bacteroidales bacterium]|nr:aspartate--tRNA ligase [Bacteroidales bacterium]HPL04768.1 aspartate--tRNA ligase [Bacteroidales bacterium]
MYRTHNCGELRSKNIGQKVKLSGWVQLKRDKGGMIWIDLRDRYGITQLAIEEANTSKEIIETIDKIGREYVISVTGEVIERYSKNDKMPTGDIEIKVEEIEILNESETPPFTIIDNSDGGDELRMKYRYLDIRRNPVKNALLLRHKMAQEIRKYLDEKDFIEVETPVLIKSTPEGARDFVVPSRMHQGEFYALPQSPQTFKQLLMVAGMDKYFQIVKCFRDEDLRADRQPEFTQVDCEMSFVNQNDIIATFEAMTKHLFKTIKNIDIDYDFPQMTYKEAMEKYGNDKPDIRFGMTITDITNLVKGKDFVVFDSAEYIGAIALENASEYSRKQIDALTDFVKTPQIGAKGLVFCKYNIDGSFKSSVDKFFNENDWTKISQAMQAKQGDLILIIAGEKDASLNALSELRLKLADENGLRSKDNFAPLWVIEFPLLEYDKETDRFYAKHHPFTAPFDEDIKLFDTDPSKIRAKAYDLVINGVEIGGGSIRIFNKDLQALMFKNLGFSEEEAQEQFGFLMNAFKYGAPPHGGIALGFDRLVSMFGGSDSIRDYIAFPKNNAGRDVMIESPSTISQAQLDELGLIIKK